MRRLFDKMRKNKHGDLNSNQITSSPNTQPEESETNERTQKKILALQKQIDELKESESEYSEYMVLF